jgi:hypothetical protein
VPFLDVCQRELAEAELLLCFAADGLDSLPELEILADELPALGGPVDDLFEVSLMACIAESTDA